MNIRELLLGDVVRMRYVHRFGTCRVLTKETVAEHVAFTGIYSTLVARWVRRHNPSVVVNVGKLLERALFHDIEEVITGDMPRPHKHSNPQLALLMEQSAMTCAKEVFTRIELDDEDTIELFDGWNTAKSDGYEGRILSFADFLSAISFIFQEVQGGNRTIEKHISSCREYTNTFKSARYDFIAPLVLQTEALMDEVFSTFSVGKR